MSMAAHLRIVAESRAGVSSHVDSSPVRLVQVQAADRASPGLRQPLQQARLVEAVPTAELAPRHAVLILAAEADDALLLGMHLVRPQHSDVTDNLRISPAVAQELPEPPDQRLRCQGRDSCRQQHQGLERLQHRGLHDELADLLAMARFVQQQHGAEAPDEEEQRNRWHADWPPKLQHQEAQEPDLQGAVAGLVLCCYVGGHAAEEQPHGDGQCEHCAAEHHDDALPELPHEPRHTRSLQVIQPPRKYCVQQPEDKPPENVPRDVGLAVLCPAVPAQDDPPCPLRL
mmetsp:Transcript_106705/g.329664  ORF Transcript_106705/g.329664 Transcript_106705/m.329664 type:complete len:286 (+) Transcript_106705:161-1018(+)